MVGWDENAASIVLDAPADGYVFIDRSWWPGWQVSVDGVGVTPQRAWGGQLVPVPAGAHAVEERLVPWDAGLGALLSIGSLTIIGVWAWRRRTPGQMPGWSPA